MMELIDAKGLACPQPVVLTKKALDEYNEVTVIVDNSTARENVRRLASSLKCIVDVTEESNGIFRISIKKQLPDESIADMGESSEEVPVSVSGPTVFAIASDVMGCGNNDLGAILMKAFLHTYLDLDKRPDFMIFYNTGVRLVVSDSDVIDDLRTLEKKDVKIMVCGTCLNFFNLTEQVGAGIVSNMYDIADVLSKAGRVVKP